MKPSDLTVSDQFCGAGGSSVGGGESGEVKELTMGSLFAGIGAFELAFSRAGFRPAWSVEIDPDCRRVLARHFPETVIAEDVRKVGVHNLARVDVIAGGFPCQDVSTAGNRRGLSGERSGLFWEMLRIVDELQPSFVLWENVPGLLSTCSCRECGRRCAACGALAGPDDTECGSCGGAKLRGRVLPGHRGADLFTIVSALGFVGLDGAWTLLDARWFGVPQRRPRLFGCFAQRHLGASRCAEILSFAARLSGHPAESGETGTDTASALTGGACHGGADDNDAQGGHLTVYGTSGQSAWRSDRVTLSASDDNGTNAVCVTGDVTYALTSEGMDASEDGTGRGTPIAVRPILEVGARQGTKSDKRDGIGVGEPDDPMFTLQAGKQHGVAVLPFDTTQITSATNRSQPRAGDSCHPLAAGAHAPAIAFSCKDDGRDASEDIAPTLRSMNYDESHLNGGGQAAALAKGDVGWGVRRLTPTECERLMGLPDEQKTVAMRVEWDSSDHQKNCVLVGNLNLRLQRRAGTVASTQSLETVWSVDKDSRRRPQSGRKRVALSVRIESGQMVVESHSPEKLLWSADSAVGADSSPLRVAGADFVRSVARMLTTLEQTVRSGRAESLQKSRRFTRQPSGNSAAIPSGEETIEPVAVAPDGAPTGKTHATTFTTSPVEPSFQNSDSDWRILCSSVATAIVSSIPDITHDTSSCDLSLTVTSGWTAHDAEGKGISDSVRYRMLGNSLVIPVAEWIAQRMRLSLLHLGEAS